MNTKKNIAIFASGGGSNAKEIYKWSLQEDSSYQVACLLSNNSSSGVLPFAKEKNIASKVFSKNQFTKSNEILEYLFDKDVEFVVLAGFLWLVPNNLITAFPKRIVNIHPALLPNYGGKGMYGHHVHEAVHKKGDNESGMTIHYVNQKYDEGNMIFQAQCQLDKKDGPADIAKRVLRLEHHFYPKVINGVVRSLN